MVKDWVNFSEIRDKETFSFLLLDILLEILDTIIRPKKMNSVLKEEIKWSFFTDNMIVYGYIKSQGIYKKENHLNLRSEFSEVPGHKIDT